MESGSGGGAAAAGRAELARALWVKLALTGDRREWQPCLVCKAPTLMPIACQQTAGQMTADQLREMRDYSPSGLDCWNVEQLWDSWEKIDLYRSRR